MNHSAKNSSSTRFLFLISCVAVFGAFSGLAKGDDQDVAVFSGKDQIRPGWEASTWGDGLSVQTGKGGRTADSSFTGTALTPKAAAYSGFSLHTQFGKDVQIASIPLSTALKTSGFVEFYVNCGKELPGNEPGAAKFKVILLFATKEGKTQSVPGSAIEVPALDADPATWELVRVPLSGALTNIAGGVDGVTGLAGVNLQYIDSPTCDIQVTDCFVKTK